MVTLRATGANANAGSEARARATTRGGRKRMSPAQRKAVGARMKAYWAKQRRASAKKSTVKGR